HFRDVVALTGFRLTHNRNTLHEIEFEMPRMVESPEQGIAWLTWCLDKRAALAQIPPRRPIPWLAEGRRHFDLLPWERERVAYDARPRCYVWRNWARPALRHLGEVLASASDDDLVVFGWDGEILTIRCHGQVIPLPTYDGAP